MTDEMNHFLRANKIIDIKKELAMLDGNSCWTFCITYLQDARLAGSAAAARLGGSKVDYKEVLDAETFERFSAFRKLRKQIAESEAVPAYAVFTDAELAEIAKLKSLTLSAMQAIPGIGKKKMEKYGNAFIANQKEETDETNGQPDGKDSDA